MPHSVTVVEAVTTTSETVVVIGGLVMVVLTVTVAAGIEVVEVIFRVVVEGVIEKQEQADDIFDGLNAVK